MPPRTDAKALPVQETDQPVPPAGLRGGPASIGASLDEWVARPLVILAVWAVCALLLLARNPDVLLHPGFWAEDGWVWYPDAYTFGVRGLLVPLAGYLQVLPRLVGLLVQLFPLSWAPGAFAFAALLVQALPPAFLVSARMGQAWPDLRGRVLFALVWVALPNTREVYVNLTNAQWHLATLAFLVLMSHPPAGRPGRVLDGAVLALSGLSGPFCMVLAPAAAWMAWARRDRASLWRAAIVFAAAAVQGACVAATIHQRTPEALGAEVVLLARIVSEQVVIGAILGQANMADITALGAWDTGVLPLLAAAGAVALACAALLRSGRSLRLAVLCATLLFAAALSHPQISDAGAQWPDMQKPGVGQRYYLIPMLAWLAMLFHLAGSGVRWRRAAGTALLGCAAIGIWSDWQIEPHPRADFTAQADAFDAAPPGTRMEFPIPPLFDRQPMRLVKK